MKADAKLRKWLNHKPRPAYMLCDDTRVDAPASDRGWAEVAESIEQLNPSRIQCHSGDGKLLRAKPLSYFFPDEVPAEPEEKPSDEPLPLFARLLAQAYDNAGKNFQPLAQHAMDLVERQASTIAKLQADLDRARNEIVKLRSELAQLEAEPASDGDGGLVGAVMQGLQAAAAQGDGSVTPIDKAKGKPK